ncbi:MAG: hypothetical protein A3I05_03385 [Deltaproteobacteria bacterium RIFCSPLOWO2_02_FULL_44_10]|nr:MAG: hypothetical protein A3C46_02960 [Deltaproteobacteria bacterium RIFCSPHIGHO2_02_FULL_44_16]OGQ46216.1 MAG: hypothetical protein A3I05_03385 [Deltaproteobacteria bacterium RIFCSPLOWO2_02_FULL_44_10]
MPVEAVVGKLNAEALSKAVEKSNVAAQDQTKANGFQEALSAAENSGTEFANMLGYGNTDITPTNKMEIISADLVDYNPTQQVPSYEAPQGSEKLVDLLGEVNKGQMQMDSLVNHILYSGKRFSNQELLVVQAHVFHFAQMTELTVKLAEHGVSSFKQVTNTQFQ